MSKPSRDDFDKELSKAVRAADAKLADKLRLPPELVKGICPAPIDRQRLDALLLAVASASSDHEAQKKLIENLESCGAVVVRLLRAIALP